MNRTLGEVLEKLRIDLSLSLREAAKRSGLSYTYIRDIERGYNRSTKAPIKPTPETLQRLAKAYNYSYDELMQTAGYIEDTPEPADNVDPELLEVLSQLSEEQQRRILERLDHPTSKRPLDLGSFRSPRMNSTSMTAPLSSSWKCS